MNWSDVVYRIMDKLIQLGREMQLLVVFLLALIIILSLIRIKNKESIYGALGCVIMVIFLVVYFYDSHYQSPLDIYSQNQKYIPDTSMSQFAKECTGLNNGVFDEYLVIGNPRKDVITNCYYQLESIDENAKEIMISIGAIDSTGNMSPGDTYKFPCKENCGSIVKDSVRYSLSFSDIRSDINEVHLKITKI